MFRIKKREITIVADVNYAVDLEAFLNHNVKTYGAHNVYVKRDSVFYTFTTKLTTKEVADLFKKKIYKGKVLYSDCGLVIVDFYLK